MAPAAEAGVRAAASVCLLAATWGGAARADFRYVQTIRQGAASGATTRQYFKGQKLRIESGDHVAILDLGAKTITALDPKQKTYTTQKIDPAGISLKGSAVELKSALRETGSRKTIGGHEAKQVLVTMDVDAPGRAGAKVQVEAELWMASDIPGAQEMREFQRQGGSMLLGSGGAGSGMGKTLADLQRAIGQIGGIPVLQTVRLKLGGAAAPLMEISTEASGFSTESIAASMFSVPAGYHDAKAAAKAPGKSK